MRMTAEEMAKQLKAQGYKVKLYYRKEGGARISSINGKSFTGSTGNKTARQLLGQSLSAVQQKHLEKIRTNKGTFGHRKKEAIDKSLQNMQNKINREFKKQGKEMRVTRSKLRYRLKKYGEAETRDYLERAYRYAKGYTYNENLIAYKQRLEIDNSTLQNKDIRKLITAVDNLITQSKNLKETDFQELLGITYDWENGVIKTKDFVRSAYVILGKAE